MPRSLTFGYNAALALDELVIDRFVGADYDEMLIADSFRHDFDEEWAAGTAHFYFTRPHIAFDPVREGKDAVLQLPLLRVMAFFTRTPPGFEDTEDISVEVAVEFSLQRDPSTGDLRPSFATTTEADITATCLDPDPEEEPVKALLIEAVMPPLIVQALSGGRFDGIAVPLDINENFMYANAADVKVINDTGIDDIDTLNLAFYEAGHDETRGRTTAIPNFMVDGKTLTFLLSRAVFELMVEAHLNNRFMNFETQVGEEEFEDPRLALRISPPDADGLVTVTGLTSSMHASVSGRVENGTRGGSVSFNTDEDGIFDVVLAASVGDTLRFSGSYFTDRESGTTIRVYPPSIALRDGSIGVSGTAWVDRLGGMDVDFDGDVYLQIDPVTGAMTPSTDASVDLPCLGDFIMVLIACVIGPFVGLLYSWFEEDVAEAINDFFSDSGLTLIPGLSDPDRIAPFVEDIEIHSNGITVSGQMDAGWIHNAGRTAEHQLSLDLARFEVDTDSAAATVTNAQLRRVYGTGFEKLGPEEIPEYWHRWSRSVTFAGLSDMDGRVFAIVTDQGRFAKVRIDLIDGVRPVLRWVTYNPPIAAAVELSIHWQNDGDWGSDGLFTWGGAETYWGTFDADCTRLHTDGPLDVVWEYSCDVYGDSGIAPADMITFTPVSSNPLQQDLEVSTTGLGETVIIRITITVTVTDVFGRTATTTYRVTAQPPYRNRRIMRPEQWRGGPARPPKPYQDWIRSIKELVVEVEEETDETVARDKKGDLRDELYAMAEDMDASIATNTSMSTETETGSMERRAAKVPRG